MGNPIPALSVLIAVLSDSSYAVVIGSSLAVFWLDAVAVSDFADGRLTAKFDTQLRRVWTLSAAVFVICHLVRPWFVASTMSGSTNFVEVVALVPTILSSTRQGGLWYANSAALGVLLAGRLLTRKRPLAIASCIQIVAFSALAATKAASSHASEEGDFSLAEICQFLQLLATAVWSGSIIVSGLVVVPHLEAAGKIPALWSYGRRLSKFVTWALLVLVLSGLYISWRDTHGAVNVFWISSWGKILITKAAFVGLAALLGSLTRFRCIGHLANSERASVMKKLLRSEAAVMVAILFISGILANTNPST